MHFHKTVILGGFHQMPGVVVQNHFHQHIAGKELAAGGLFLAAYELNDVLRGMSTRRKLFRFCCFTAPSSQAGLLLKAAVVWTTYHRTFSHCRPCQWSAPRTGRRDDGRVSERRSVSGAGALGFCSSVFPDCFLRYSQSIP